MNYHDIKTDNMDNGDGLRVVVWVSGCNHHCKECQNPDTWNPNSGKKFDNSAFDEVRKELSKDYISGLTITGGDPFYPSNRQYISQLVGLLKYEFPNKTIWIYTGYTYEELSKIGEPSMFSISNILCNIDVLVDGKFIDKFKDTSLMWRGSPNQRVINMKKTRWNRKLISHIPLEDQVKSMFPDISKSMQYYDL